MTSKLIALLASGAALTANSGVQTDLSARNSAESAPMAPAPQGDGDRIPIKTEVEIEITDTISSKTNVIGDTFGLKLATPLVIGGRTILPAGLAGRGEVTHAAKKGGGGKAGELIVNARYLDCGGLRIPLGHLHYQVVGQNNVGGAYAASVVPFGQFLVSGHDAIIPAGTIGTAQVNSEVALPPGSLGQCAATN